MCFSSTLNVKRSNPRIIKGSSQGSHSSIGAALREVAATYRFVQGAQFSAISPGTSLIPHCGPTNGRMVLHLGLSVPHPGAAVLLHFENEMVKSLQIGKGLDQRSHSFESRRFGSVDLRDSVPPRLTCTVASCPREMPPRWSGVRVKALFGTIRPAMRWCGVLKGLEWMEWIEWMAALALRTRWTSMRSTRARPLRKHSLVPLPCSKWYCCAACEAPGLWLGKASSGLPHPPSHSCLPSGILVACAVGVWQAYVAFESALV